MSVMGEKITLRVDQSLRDKIASEIRQEESQRDLDMRMERIIVPSNTVRLLPVENLRPGNVIIATENGTRWFEYAVVTENVPHPSYTGSRLIRLKGRMNWTSSETMNPSNTVAVRA